jgi:hypothetical protein
MQTNKIIMKIFGSYLLIKFLYVSSNGLLKLKIMDQLVD